MKVWIGLSPDDVQGMEFDLTPLELRDLNRKNLTGFLLNFQVGEPGRLLYILK